MEVLRNRTTSARPPGRGALFNDVLASARYVVELTTSELERDRVDAELYWLLARIEQLQPVTPTELSDASGVGKTTLRDALQRLVDRGEVARTPNPRDARSYLVTLTPRGLRRFRAGGAAMRRAIRALDRQLELPLEEAMSVAAALRAALGRAAAGAKASALQLP
jgi:DNA-binding MarR family transcriptional regulator